MNGGNASSSYTNGINGGFASDVADSYIDGGYASQGVANTLVNMMNKKLQSSNECWSEFNTKFKYQRFLTEFSETNSFYRPSDVPDAPIPADNPDLNC